MGGMAKAVLPVAASALGGYFLGPAIGAAFAGESAAGGAMGVAMGEAASGVTAAQASAIGSGIGGLAGAAVVGSQKPPSIETPTIPTVPMMPNPDSAAVAAARQQSIASQVARRGRASTILTQDGLGAGTKLGS